MRKLTKLTIGAAGLVVVAGAFADVPQKILGNNYDQYTVSATGQIILNNNVTGTNPNGCPIGATCTVLDATGPGILQQKVQFSGDGTFYQTIIVDDGATSVSDPKTLGFRNESYVDAGNTGAAPNLAILNVVNAGSTATLDAMSTTFEEQQGTLIGADPTSPIGVKAGETIEQHNQLGATARGVDFYYEDGGPANKRMAINNGNPNNEGQFTLRKVTGYYVPAAGSLTLSDGQELDYAAGANLQEVYVTQAASGNGVQANRLFGLTSVDELGDSEGIGGVVLQHIGMTNADAQGNFNVVLGAAGTQAVGSGPQLTPYPTALFGAAPLTYNSNGTGGAVAPTGTNGPGTSKFWNSPPPWFTIVP